jgi:phenylalanyl-tRNA synthetase alpha chain
MNEELDRTRRTATGELAEVRDLSSLDRWKVKYLGRKGELSSLMTRLSQIPPEERPAFGMEANSLKQELTAACQARFEEIREALEAEKLVREKVDTTLPGRPLTAGNLHLATKTLGKIIDIFTRMGFQVLESPEVETDDYNFTFLNMPQDHPAREMWDTFYLEGGNLLRTHTSPGQIHAMRRFHPNPVRVVLPGKCYRYEAVTSRSEFMFHQVEGLAIGESITMADLKGVLISFARQMFGGERQVRLRCSYFPFTEPSVEVDMDCILCRGEGCRLCKETGWLEIAGAGMVHPTVLASGDYDPEKYTGFAFGMGPERIAMLIHQIDDIRYFYGNDLRFLRQF